MERKRPSNPIISTGTTSIVLIFVMLCMLTFSVLSLVSAQANLRLSRLSAGRTTDYYAAENAANDVLIRIEDAAVQTAQSHVPSEEEDTEQAWDFAADVLMRLGSADGITLTGGGRMAYQVPLGKNQMLYVELRLSPEPFADGRHYEINTWQAVSGYDWTRDDSLELARPGNMPTGLE